MPARLDPGPLAAALEKLPGWEVRDGKLARTYRFRDFADHDRTSS